MPRIEVLFFSMSFPKRDTFTCSFYEKVERSECCENLNCYCVSYFPRSAFSVLVEAPIIFTYFYSMFQWKLKESGDELNIRGWSKIILRGGDLILLRTITLQGYLVSKCAYHFKHQAHRERLLYFFVVFIKFFESNAPTRLNIGWKTLSSGHV